MKIKKEKLWKYKCKQPLFSDLYKIDYFNHILQKKEVKKYQQILGVTKHFRKIKKDGNQLIRIFYLNFLMFNLKKQNFGDLQFQGFQKILNSINIKLVKLKTIPEFYHSIYHHKIIIQELVNGLYTLSNWKKWMQNQLTQQTLINFIHKHAIMDFFLIIFMRCFIKHTYDQKQAQFLIEQQDLQDIMNYNQSFNVNLFPLFCQTICSSIKMYQIQNGYLSKYVFNPKQDTNNLIMIFLFQNEWYYLPNYNISKQQQKFIKTIEKDMIKIQKQNKIRQQMERKFSKQKYINDYHEQRKKIRNQKNILLFSKFKQSIQLRKKKLIQNNHTQQTIKNPFSQDKNKHFCISCQKQQALTESYKGLFCHNCQSQFHHYMDQYKTDSDIMPMKVSNYLKKLKFCVYCQKNILDKPLRSIRGTFCSQECFQSQLKRQNQFFQKENFLKPNNLSHSPSIKNESIQKAKQKLSYRPYFKNTPKNMVQKIYLNAANISKPKKGKKTCSNCKMICYGNLDYAYCGRKCQLNQDYSKKYIQNFTLLPAVHKKDW